MSPSLIFHLALTLLLLLVQWFSFRQTSGAAAQRPALQRTIAILFLLFCMPLPVLVFWHPDHEDLPIWARLGLVYPFYVWHFTFLVITLVWVAGKLLGFPVQAAGWLARRVHLTEKQKSPPALESRRIFLKQGFSVLASFSLAGTGYAAYRGSSLETTEAHLPFAGLPPEFDGFTIALVSDIHSGFFMSREQMDAYADSVNRLGADLIAVPGDFVNSSLDEAYPFAESFSRLRAPYGVYGVLGNHDFYTHQVETVAKVVEDSGIRLLRNSRIAIRRGEKTLVVAGVDDTGSPPVAGRLFDISLDGVPPGASTVMLCHRPYFFPEAARRRIGLLLAGHTHGGQIVLLKVAGDSVAPARLASRYVAGRYMLGSSVMYVSRGVGMVGVPIRINCPPEITRITLHRPREA